MHETRRARRIPGPGAILIALSLAPAATAAQISPGPPPAYAVVLKDGTTVAAATRPLIAMGQVSFLDAGKRPCTLFVQRVDVDATRARMGTPAASSRRWDARSLAHVGGNVQILGESEGSETDGATPTGAASPPDPSDLTQAERIRAEIGRLDDQIRPLDPKDHQRTVVMLRQMELQSELNRVLDPSAQG